MSAKLARLNSVTSRTLVTMVGRMIGSVTDRKMRQRAVPSIKAASMTSDGTARKPEDRISMEKPAVDQTFAKVTISIGKWFSESPSPGVTKLRVPPDVVKAYHTTATVIGGSIHATMATAPTPARSQAA